MAASDGGKKSGLCFDAGKTRSRQRIVGRNRRNTASKIVLERRGGGEGIENRFRPIFQLGSILSSGLSTDLIARQIVGISFVHLVISLSRPLGLSMLLRQFSDFR